jgi:acyl carrier protein
MKENEKDIFFDIFKDVMSVDNVDLNYNIKNLSRWDSLKTVEMIIEIEKVFNIKIQREHLPEMNSVSKILNVLDKYLK